MEKTKLNRGGKREGAGRKRLGEHRRVTLAVRISPEALRVVEELAERQGMSKGALIDQIINEYGKR